MDLTALFKIQYGLFVVGVEQEGRLNACVVNTVAQATAEPPQLTLTMQKRNFTTELARKKGSVAISVLGEKTPIELIERLGTQSGRDTDKMEDVPCTRDVAGNPLLVGNGVVAHYSAEITSEVDLGSHYLFVLKPTALEKLDGTPTTYSGYRARKSTGGKQWVCTICHYVYDGATPFEELPDSWVCPVCGEPKSAFVLE